MKKLLSTLCLLAFATQAEAQINARLDWTDLADNETGTLVERNLNGSPFVGIVTLNGGNIVSYTDFTVVAPTTPGAPDNNYCYRVFYFNSVGNSLASNVACKAFVAPKITVPVAPGGLTVSAISSTGTRVTWDDKADNEIGYGVESKLASGNKQFVPLVTVAANVTTIDNTGLKKYTSYCYRVKALGQQSMDSAYTDTRCATTSK